MTHFRVTFFPSERTVTAGKGRTLLETARDGGIHIESPCGGKGKCGKCRVRVIEGSSGEFTETEGAFISDPEREEGYRLACSARVEGDLQVFVPQSSLLHTGASSKEFGKRTRDLRPAVKAYRLDLPGDLNTPAPSEGLSALICATLKERHGVDIESVDPSAFDEYGDGAFSRIAFRSDVAHLKPLSTLADPISVKTSGKRCSTGSAASGLLTVYVRMGKEILRVLPGGGRAVPGLAIDVGTTTVALYLCELETGAVVRSASFTNPQVAYGADVLSRIDYSVKNPGSGVVRMQKDLMVAINRVAGDMARDAGFSLSEVMDATAVGNTVMQHIFLGVPPDPLGSWPFRPPVETSVDRKGRDLGLAIGTAAYVHVFPVEAGFVGGDNVAVLISEEPHRKEETSLIIDLGTNGEIALGNRKRLLSCSCATGPAFEGGRISAGIRAVQGAIEKIRIDAVSLEADYSVVGRKGWASEQKRGILKPTGICGSGIIDAIAEMFRTGIIDRGGRFRKDLPTPRLRTGMGGTREYVLSWEDETETGMAITVTQQDVRQIQLAKGALRAGCEILLKRFGIAEADRVVIAGAFGLHIDMTSALAIGLLPPWAAGRISSVGNAAGHGAYLALLNIGKREEAEGLARSVEHVELALEKEFQGEFMRALSIPHGEGSRMGNPSSSRDSSQIAAG